MNEALPGIYRSEEFRRDLRSRARVFWVAVSAVSFFWLLLIVGTPLIEAAGDHSLAAGLYGFFGYICHQMPDRSFHILGEKFAVCSRCFGVYFGLFAGLIAYPFLRPMDRSDPLPRVWLFASMAPMAVDWSLGYFGILANTFFTRVTTGLILGVACAVYIVPALIELAEIRLENAHTRTKEAA